MIYKELGFWTLNEFLGLKNWRECLTVTFDLETDGLDPENDRILQFAATLSRAGEYGAEIIDEISFFINSEREIPENITKITGITESNISDCPPFADRVGDILEFLDRGDFISGHNIVAFDIPFLKHSIERAGYDVTMNFPVFDTWLFEWRRKEFRKSGTTLIKSAKAHAVGRVAKIISGNLSAHNAINDVSMNADLVWAMAEETVNEYSVKRIMDIQLDLRKKKIENEVVDERRKKAKALKRAEERRKKMIDKILDVDNRPDVNSLTFEEHQERLNEQLDQMSQVLNAEEMAEWCQIARQEMETIKESLNERQ